MAKKPASRTVRVKSPKVEINFGRITYLSPDKGAFVELITERAMESSAVDDPQQKKNEVFVPKEVLGSKKNLDKDNLVQLKRRGDTVFDIEPL